VPGSQYAFAVWASNSSGSSSPAGTAWVTVNRGCASTAFCLRADATRPAGPISHSASGFLHGTWALPSSVTSPLAPTSWRVSIVPSGSGWDFSEYDVARQAGASTITVVISDAWFRATSGGCPAPSSTCGAATPWTELPTYSAWVRAYVRLIEASGRHPTFWDIQNEPDAAVAPGDYFNTAGASTVTPSNMMALFTAGNRAVKAADPSARVEGPSLSEFRTAPDSARLDLTTFLDASAANGLTWDAISWHENGGSYKPPTHWGWLPDETIPNDVATVQALLAAHPTLGTPALAVNEFGTQEESVLPGWIAGEIAALEHAGVTYADRTCWVTATDPASPGGCNSYPSTLDELLLSTGDRAAAYHVFAAYAALQGTLVSTSPSDVTFSELGAIDGAGTLRLLVGRHVGCTAAVNADCPFPASWTPPPVDVPISVTLPWSGSARVVVQRIPNVRGPVPAPITVTSTVMTVTGGQLNVLLPTFADGDAMTITVQPA
jgi:hypothetical protein